MGGTTHSSPELHLEALSPNDLRGWWKMVLEEAAGTLAA